MYVFYGAFAPVIALGIVLVFRRQEPSAAAFVAAWAVSYLVLNVASGSLPGPNLVRYNKDLEIVAPLFCVALAVVAETLWQRSRAIAWAFGLAYAIFARRARRDLPHDEVRTRALTRSSFISSSRIPCSARTMSSRGTSALRNWSDEREVLLARLIPEDVMPRPPAARRLGLRFLRDAARLLARAALVLQPSDHLRHFLRRGLTNDL